VYLLVLDDNVDAADSLALLLRLWGHSALVAYDVETAFVLALRHRPHAAFLDLKLARGSGQELAGRLRAESTLKGMVLIAVTGLNDEADLLRARECGVDYVYRKPASPEELRDLLERVAIPPNLPGARPTLRLPVMRPAK
jgi:DNA-binding response OmpR family regulator